MNFVIDFGEALVKSSNLKDYAITKQFTGASVTLKTGNAYDGTEYTLQCPVPTGYKAIEICRVWATNSGCNVYNAYFADSAHDSVKMAISNLSGKIQSVSVYATILYIRA